MDKVALSKVEIKTTIGFIYWVNEHHDLRGLKDLKIEEYTSKLEDLQEEYDKKYPNGLIGWRN